MRESATIAFRDENSAEEVTVIVRYGPKKVALRVSLKSDGDVEVVMKKSVAKELIAALKNAAQAT